MNPLDEPTSPPYTSNSNTVPIAIIAITLLLALGMLLAYRAFSHATKAVADGIKDAFSTSEKITQTFRSEVERVISTHGSILVLAVSESDEYFRSENEKRALGGNVYLGTTLAEIDARCTFSYHLNLSDQWNLNVRSNICVVHAPCFRPSLPVAIQTDTMRKHAESGWARFDKNDKLNALEATMTGDLAHRATDQRHLHAVRETCRQSVADFVRNWLLREDYWGKDHFTQIIVQFPDDEKPLTIPWFSDQPPAIQLKN